MKEIATLMNTILNVQLTVKFTEIDVISVKPFAWQALEEKTFNSEDVKTLLHLICSIEVRNQYCQYFIALPTS